MAATSSFAIDVPDALLARARAGDRAAFEQLYRWFERPVFTLALRICGDREEAADVLQETMLKVLARIGDFRGRDGSPFWGWLRQVAVNEALMRLRRDRRHSHEVPEDGEFGDDLSPPPAAAADAAALQRALAVLHEGGYGDWAVPIAGWGAALDVALGLALFVRPWTARW